MNPKIDLSFDPKPSEVKSFDKKNPDKAYISGILSTYQPTFVVGMYCILQTYIFCKLKLKKASTVYFVFGDIIDEFKQCHTWYHI